MTTTGSRDGAALRGRFDELAERLRELDLRARIAASPWPVVGVAALLGAWFAFAPRPSRREPVESRALADIAFGALGAMAVRLVRDATLRQVGTLARRWWEATSPHEGGEPPEYHH